MRASLTLAFAVLVGCAPALESVPNTDWKSVPTARRAHVDDAFFAERTRLEHDLADEIKRAAIAPVQPAPAKATPAAATKPTAASTDDWAAAMAQYDREKAQARAQIDAAMLARQHAETAFHVARVELLERQLDELRAQHELDRATMIDRGLLGDETYETATYRGQLAKFQAPRYAAEQRVDAARTAMQQASSAMAMAKDLYASLVRTGPLAPTSSDHDLQLTAFQPTAHYARASYHARHYLTPPVSTLPRIAGR